jgi:hypothetical protein
MSHQVSFRTSRFKIIDAIRTRMDIIVAITLAIVVISEAASE